MFVLVGLGLFLVIVISVKRLAGGRNQDIRRVLPVRDWVWRFFTGQHLDGQRRTDAMYRYRGDRPMRGVSRATKWQYRAGYERQLIRLAWLFGVLLFPLAWFTYNDLTRVVIFFLVTSYLSWKVCQLWMWVTRFQYTRNWVVPLHLALHREIGIRADIAPEDWIHIPQNFRVSYEAQAIIDLPMGYNRTAAKARDAIIQIVSWKLGLYDLVPHWRLEGRTPHLILNRAVPPPELVRYDDVIDILTRLPESKILMGLGPSSVPTIIDLDNEAPHVLLSMGPGTGKSNVVRGIMAQSFHKNSRPKGRKVRVILIDPKGGRAHQWVRGRSDVVYCRTPEQIHTVWLAIQDEMTARYDRIDSDEDVGPRILLVIEEINAMMMILNQHWRKTKGPKDPKMSPALEAMQSLLFMSREALINMIAISQLATARSVGGTEARTCYGAMALGRLTKANWRMLAEQAGEMPPMTKKPGRFYVVMGSDVKLTQGILLEEPDVIRLAGIPVPLDGKAIETVEQPAITQRVGLQEACELGWLPGLSYPAARQARYRDRKTGRFVDTEDNLYTQEELTQWLIRRNGGAL